MFKEQNLLTDRFDQNFDLIMCRNVVIYFSDAAKIDLNRKFSNSLKIGGILFIGGTETIMNPQEFGLARHGAAFFRKEHTDRQLRQAA